MGFRLKPIGSEKEDWMTLALCATWFIIGFAFCFILFVRGVITLGV